MLIKESTLRRIIREEARRSLREETAPPATVPGGLADQWKGLSQRISGIAASFSTAIPGGGGPKLLAAVKDLIAKGNQSKYAALAVAVPSAVTNAPPTANGEIGRLVCLMASLADNKKYTDYASAQTILTGKSSPTQDLVGPIVIKALGGNANTATSIMDDIKTLGSNPAPGYTAPAQNPQVNISDNLKAVAGGKQVLRQGSKGAAVTDLQNLLNMISPGSVTVDGDYGNETIEAVKAYQTAKKIKVDGIVGRETLSSMFGQRASMTGAAPAGSAYLGSADIIGTTPTQNESRRRR